MKAAIRIAIYGRHSTALQNPESSNDQVRACAPLVDRLRGEVVSIHTDPEMSGYRRDRPGLQNLLAKVRAGEIDMVICEALDRIARDGEDVAWLGKKLRYDRVSLHTTEEGEIDEVKLAVASMMGALFLANLRKKTLRGLEASVLAGRMAGGRVYGYKAVTRLNGNGDPIRGLVEIDPVAARVVVGILTDFAAGKSAYTIARDLNEQRVPGPSGGKWNQSTIRGDPKKCVGLLHNPLYRGMLVWGRREWRRDPDSIKRERRYRLRDRSEWVVKEVPDLAIISPALAQQVDDEVSLRARPTCSGNSAGAMRKKHLLSGLIKCGSCGGNYVINGKDYYRCAGNREGKCQSSGSIRKSRIEEAAMSVIKKRLMTQELAELFAAEFTREVRRLRGDVDGEAKRLSTRLAALEREISNLAENFTRGIVSETLVTMLAEREAERSRLNEKLGRVCSPQAIVIPHPILLKRYAERVERAREALSDPSVREEASKTLRALIDTITIHEDDNRILADICGNPGKIIELAYEEPATSKRRPASSIAMVAGVGFEPTTFRL